MLEALGRFAGAAGAGRADSQTVAGAAAPWPQDPV